MEMTEIIFRAFVDTQFQGCKGKDVAIVIFLKIDAQLPKRWSVFDNNHSNSPNNLYFDVTGGNFL